MNFLLLAAFVISMPTVSAFAESNFDVTIPKGAGNPSAGTNQKAVTAQLQTSQENA